jgi:hypothetical protein
MNCNVAKLLLLHSLKFLVKSYFHIFKTKQICFIDTKKPLQISQLK